MVDAPEPSPRRDLRFEVATEEPPVAWQAHCVERLAAVPGVAIVRWIRRPNGGSRSGNGSGRTALAAVAPETLDALIRPDDAGSDAAGCPADVLLDLTTSGVEPSQAGPAAVWRYRYGDDLTADAFHAALADYVRHPGRTRVALVETTRDRILHEGLLQWWRGEELDRILLDPCSWAADAARHRIGVLESDAPGEVNGTGRARRGVPRSGLTVAALVRRAAGIASNLVRHEDWNVGLIDAPLHAVVASDHLPAITWLPTRRGRYAADPFGIERDGTLHVFFEDYDLRAARGTIARVEIGSDGAVSKPVLVLDPGVHSSYPFLFEHDGRVFLLPETAALGRLVLYEAASFPDDFRPVATLLEGVPAVDASVVEHDGRWWMFATRRDRGANHSLSIWHAPEPLGPWSPHAANPVKIDARSARPGGRPYVVDGVLFRPSQDSSRAYGGRIVINRVDVLTPTAFSEQQVGAIEPPPGTPYRDGLHTLSAAGSRTLVDGNREHLVTATLRHDLTARAARLTRRFR